MAERPKLNLNKIKRGLEAAEEAKRRAQEGEAPEPIDAQPERGVKEQAVPPRQVGIYDDLVRKYGHRSPANRDAVEDEKRHVEESIANAQRELEKQHGGKAEETVKEIRELERHLAAIERFANESSPQADTDAKEPSAVESLATNAKHMARGPEHAGRGHSTAENLSEVKTEVAAAANERLGDTIEAIKAFQESVCEQANGHIMQIDQLERVPLVEFDESTKTVKPVDIDELPLREVVERFKESIAAYREYTRIKVADADAARETLAKMEKHQQQLVRALNGNK